MSALVDIKIQAAGRWVSILQSLGMDSRYFSGKHQSCPLCGDGKDRFRFNRATEYAHCNVCGSKSPVDLAIAWLSKPYIETVREIRAVLGDTQMTTVQPTTDTAKNQARIDAIKATLKPLNGRCAASQYLAKRGVISMPERDCYFAPAVDYWGEVDGKLMKSSHPAMVSIFRNLEGKGATFHITYLTPSGEKANVDQAKKVLPVVLPLSGCAIQLFKPTDGILAIAEGVETALAVHQLDGLPVWASGNAQQMATLELPTLKELWIYADSDPSFTGQSAAYALARRYAGKFKVRVNTLIERQWIVDSGDRFDFLEYAQQTSRTQQVA
jgi:putative DNA primase/helicase